MAIKVPPPGVDVVPIRLIYPTQVTVDVADAGVKEKVPFACKILGAIGKGRAVGGDVAPTDVDVQVMKNTTELIAALPVVDGSALTAGGTQATLALSDGDLDMAADDFLHLKLINVTGGTNPTFDGLEVIVYVARK